MLQLGSIYLIVKDMDKSISFYEALLKMKVSARNYNRWAQFNFFGSCIALYNPSYDEQMITEGIELNKRYNKEYLEFFKRRTTRYGTNFVLNFFNQQKIV